MKMLRALTISMLASAAGIESLCAQNEFPTPTAGKTVIGVQLMCQNVSNQAVPCTGSVPVPISGSFSASLGAFTATPAYASLTATASSARVAFPSGTSVVIYNAGTSAVSCTPGSSSVVAVANDDQIQPQSWFTYVPGSGQTNLACIDQSGSASNLVVLSGGSGLPAGAGGGGSGGGGGAITVASGADVVEGTLGDTNTNGTIVGFLHDVWVALTTGPVPISCAACSTSAAQATGNASLATIASNTNGVAQASTTSGQNGALIMGGATTSAPTYTTATTNPLSLDTSGNLRTTCANCSAGSNASVGATGSAVPSSTTYLGASNGGTNIGVTANGSGDVNVTQTAATMINGTLNTCTSCSSFTGNGTPLNVTGMAGVLVTSSGSGVTGGTVSFQVSENGTNYSNVSGLNLSTNVIAQNYSGLISAAEVWYVPLPPGTVDFQTPISGLTAASFTITGHASPVGLRQLTENVNVTNTPAITCATCATSANQSAGTSGTPSAVVGSVQGTTASGTTLTDAPLANGGRAATAIPTAVTDGQKVSQMLSKEGKVIDKPYAPSDLDWSSGAVTSTDTSAHTLKAAGGTGIKNYLTALQCDRSDTGTTPIRITLSDAAGTTLPILDAGNGGAFGYRFPTPLSTAAVTALTFTVSSATTTVTCNGEGYQGS